MSILPFANDYHAIVHRAVAVLPPGGGNAATGRWQCCHRAVYDGKVFKKKRQNLRFSLIMTKFGETLLTRSGLIKYEGKSRPLYELKKALAEQSKSFQYQCGRGEDFA